MLIGVHSSKVTLLSFEKNWSYRKSRGTYKVISISRGSEAPFLDVDIRQCSKWSSPCDRFFFPWHRMSFCQRMWEINWKYSNYIDHFPPVSSNVAVENHENLVGGFRHVFFFFNDFPFHIWDVVLPIDFHSIIFQDGEIAPPTSII